ncbi:uncharacterized protein LOC113750673 [Coffea eugenioides]|uniref:uncharacterized protein LOC113750673 n=1 Tax=Coffea eugenioides TaxID=49369 RepID=UPI000F60EAA2|nr:uncharacterized protein LOC113750673 [Coffea eugenioides]
MLQRSCFLVQNIDFALKHLFENFKAKFKDSELRELFWATASATNVDDFKRALNALEIAQPQNRENLTTAAWLKKLPYHPWSRAYYEITAKTDISINKLNKSFNNYILKASDEPIVTLLKFFKRKLMQWLTLKTQGMEKYGGKLCPNIVKKLTKSVEKNMHYIVVFDGIDLFEINGFNRTFVMKIENYVDECYSKEAYLRAYTYSIGAVPSKEHLIDNGMQLLNPSFVKKQLGRPKKLRRRVPDEPRDPQKASTKGLTVYCKRCLKVGHNRRTCKEPPHPKSKLYKARSSNNQQRATTAFTSARIIEALVHQVSQQNSTIAVSDNNLNSWPKRSKKN